MAKPLDPGDEVRVFVVDPHPVARHGLRRLIEDTPGLAVSGTAGDVDAAVEQLTDRDVALIVVEPLTAPLAEDRLIARLAAAAPGARVLALSAHDELGFVERVRATGVVGFVSKGIDRRRLAAVLLRAAGRNGGSLPN